MAGRSDQIKINIFIYNVVSIKSKLYKLKKPNQKMVLIANHYCLGQLTKKNRQRFDFIHELNERDFHETNLQEIEEIVLSYIKEYGNKNILLLTNEDSTQITCAKLREKYTISGSSVEDILPFVNKVVSKQKIERSIRTPKYIRFDKHTFNNDKESYLDMIIQKLYLPIFIKPIDLVSSIETHKVIDRQELKNTLEKLSVHDYEFELDEYIDGELFHCDALIIDSKIKFFMVGKCSYSLANFKFGKPIGSIQVNNKKVFQKLELFCKQVFEKLNCQSGAYHLEVFLEKSTKQFIFLKIAARTGGALIPKVYEKLFSINIEEIHYAILMGIICDLKITRNNLYVGFLIFPTAKGKIVDMTFPEIKIKHEISKFVKPSEIMKQPENLLDASCNIIFWDESYKSVLKVFDLLKKYNPVNIYSDLPRKEKSKQILDILFDAMPFIFWKGKNGRYQGANANQAINLGFKSPKDFVGKTIFEILDDQDTAKIIDINDHYVMEKNKTITVEEEINGKIYYSQKSPIHDKNKKVIGMLGFSVDITEIRENEKRLQQEKDELLYAKIKAQEKFKRIRILKQIAHDIASPVASLNVLAEMGKEYLPEDVRIGYRSVTASISSISNKLLMEFNKVESTQGKESFLVLLVVNEVLSSKRYQYKDRNVEFQINSKPNDNFIFINANKLSFERMISNLVNNSVDAFEDQGKVTVDFLSGMNLNKF